MRWMLLCFILAALVPLRGHAERSIVERILDPFGLWSESKPKHDRNDLVYKVAFDIRPSVDDVGDAIRAASNLKTLEDVPPANAAALVRRAAEDRARITSALYDFAYYGSAITITVSGVSVTATDAVAAVERAHRNGVIDVRVRIVLGPKFRFGKVGFVDAATGAAVASPRGANALGIVPGHPAYATAIVAASAALAAAMKKQGRPFAAVTGRDVVADHADNTVSVTFRLKPGPKAVFGTLRVEGNERVRSSFIRRRRGFRAGEPYDPDKITSFRQELARHDVFSSIGIDEGERLDTGGRLPITVRVKEKLRHFIGFGVKYSTTDRAEINGYWGDRNLFGGAERLRVDLAASAFGSDFSGYTDPDNLGYRASVSFTKPGILTVRDDLVSQVTALREITDAYRRDGYLLSAGVRRRLTRQLSLTLGLDLEFTRVRDVFGVGNYRLIGFPLEVSYDSTDSLLDPTRGFRVNAVLEPFPSIGTTSSFVQFKGTASTYIALDDRRRWVLAGRVSGGSILGADIRDIPAHRRFYVGGGGSLRGYKYQSASPRDSLGRIVGGRSYWEASLELRKKITDTIGIVTFVDAGAAYASSIPDFKVPTRVGAGVGLRYYTSIGPLRLDVAVPLVRRSGDGDFGLYISLGQAF